MARRQTRHDTDGLPKQSGLDPIAASLGLRALDDAGYVTGIDVTTMAGLPFAMIEVRLRERGRRATAQWPNEDPTKILIHILDERISSAGDSAERTRLEVARDALLGVGRDILTSYSPRPRSALSHLTARVSSRFEPVASFGLVPSSKRLDPAFEMLP